MSFDINILALNQKGEPEKKFDTKIEVLNENDEWGKRYHSIWPFMCQSEGIWYSLVVDNGAKTAYPICIDNTSKKNKISPRPYWISDKLIEKNLTPIEIQEKYRSDFWKILTKLINASPRKTILFLARYQNPDKEIVYGTFTLNEFKKMLEKKQVFFNICYIVNKESDEDKKDVHRAINYYHVDEEEIKKRIQARRRGVKLTDASR